MGSNQTIDDKLSRNSAPKKAPLQLAAYNSAESAQQFLSDLALDKLEIHDKQVKTRAVKQAQEYLSKDNESLKQRVIKAEKEAQNRYFDSLTGLRNTSYFENVLASDIYLRDARSGHRVAILYLDVNRFKEINDQYGHEEGDKVIKAAANAITDSTRQTDIVVRKGGDEFVIYLPQTDQITAEMIARRINQTLSQETHLSFAIGGIVYEHPSTYTTADGVMKPIPPLHQLVKQADIMMYRSKKEGKVRVFTVNEKSYHDLADKVGATHRVTSHPQVYDLPPKESISHAPLH